MIEVGLSIGSNLGDRIGNLRTIRSFVSEIPGVEITAFSPVYETEPVEVPSEFEKDLFLNAILITKSMIGMEDLFSFLHDIEKEMGRDQSRPRNTPRAADIDIIYAFDLIRSTPYITWAHKTDEKGGPSQDLNVPHPRWAERRFVVQPLADVRKHLIIAGQTKTVGEVLVSLPDKPSVALFAEIW